MRLTGMEPPFWRRGCPSFLEIARCEAGDLRDLPDARIRSHAGRCPRCGGTLCDIRASRVELLGLTHATHLRAATLAATSLRK